MYRSHPDWCIHVSGREKSRGRNQLVLDLSRQDVCDYIVKVLSDILSSAPISYVKWDMNRNMSEIGSEKLPPERQSEVAHRYMLGLYGVLEMLTQRFPNVLFEGCSGGGGRFDAGMMYYFNQYWTSDDSDAVERMYIQHGTSLVMPSTFMGAHVSEVPNHQVGRVTSLETRGNIAFCGQLGYELDVTKMSEEELDAIRAQIEKYKTISDTVHNGDMYRLLSPFDSNYVAWEFISNNKNQVVVCYGTVNTLPQCKNNFVKLEALESNREYRLFGADKVYSADVLMNIGFAVENQKDFSADLYVFEKI